MNKFLGWLFPRLKTPPSYTIQIVEKGVPILGHDDDDVIATLRDHPGMVALTNRLRLQRELLKSRLETLRYKDIRDVDSTQSGLYWLRYLELEINAAIGRLQTKRAVTVAPPELTDEFEKARSAIESIEITNL